MFVPVEFDDLEQTVKDLRVEILRKNQAIDSALESLQETKKHLQACEKNVDECLWSLRQIRSEAVVSLEEYKRLCVMLEENSCYASRYRKDAYDATSNLVAIQSELPRLQAQMREAELRLAKWGALINL